MKKVWVFEKSMGFFKKYGFLKKVWVFEKSVGFLIVYKKGVNPGGLYEHRKQNYLAKTIFTP